MSLTQRSANLSLVRAINPKPAETWRERRAHERLTVSALDWLGKVRLNYGPAVALIDLSAGGAQIESVGHGLTPGSTLVIKIAGGKREDAVPARVIRCDVAAISPRVIYRGALQFKRLFKLPVATKRVPPLSADVNPLHAHARLTVAFRRLVQTGRSAAIAGLTDVAPLSLAAAQAILESPASRRAGPLFSREVTKLVELATQSIEGGTPVEELLGQVAERLRRAVPARSVRIVGSLARGIVHTPDAITFDVPSAGGDCKKLLVEFPRECRLEEWHFQLLKVAAHLVALIHEVDRVSGMPDAPDAAEMAEQESTAPAGWHRLVVRYRDGRMLKGYGRDFLPANGKVHVEAEPNGPITSRVTVALSQLKAVFFVHDFDGMAASGGRAPSPDPRGRKIAVHFIDGEVLSGMTLNYAADGPGFFVTPTAREANNLRIFIVREAVRHVTFP